LRDLAPWFATFFPHLLFNAEMQQSWGRSLDFPRLRLVADRVIQGAPLMAAWEEAMAVTRRRPRFGPAQQPRIANTKAFLRGV
jgi:hypothetical protein